MRWHSSTTSAGTPSPATNTDAPPSMIWSTWAAMSPGMAVSRSTPKGCRWPPHRGDLRHHPLVLMVDAPRQPNPPASDTAATSGA